MSGKYKGTDPHALRAGMGRLRRAHVKPAGRSSGWERLSDDDVSMERHSHQGKTSHYAEAMLARFNRLVEIDQNTVGQPGVICGFNGNAVVVRGADGAETPCALRRTLLKRIGGVRNPLAVGDRVRWLTHEAVIASVAPRYSMLARTDSHNKALIHVLCANLDVVVIVAALDRPAFQPGFVDRALIVAAANGLDSIVVLTKADLDPTDCWAAIYRGCGHEVFITAPDRADVQEALRQRLQGKTIAVAGQSGAGKSTLLNACFGLDLRTGDVDGQGLGKHTTTSARSLPIAGGGTLIDTPGIRECAIAGMTIQNVGLLMNDIARLQPHCRFADCSHQHEPDCAVRAAVLDGAIAPSRMASYLSILSEDLAKV